MIRDKKAEETTSGGQIMLYTKEMYLQKCDEIIQLKSSVLKVSPNMFSKLVIMLVISRLKQPWRDFLVIQMMN